MDAGLKQIQSTEMKATHLPIGQGKRTPQSLCPIFPSSFSSSSPRYSLASIFNLQDADVRC